LFSRFVFLCICVLHTFWLPPVARQPAPLNVYISAVIRIYIPLYIYPPAFVCLPVLHLYYAISLMVAVWSTSVACCCRAAILPLCMQQLQRFYSFCHSCCCRFGWWCCCCFWCCSCNFNVLYPRPCHSHITCCLFYLGFPSFFFLFFLYICIVIFCVAGLSAIVCVIVAAAVLQLLVRKLHFSAFYISINSAQCLCLRVFMSLFGQNFIYIKNFSLGLLFFFA